MLLAERKVEEWSQHKLGIDRSTSRYGCASLKENLEQRNIAQVWDKRLKEIGFIHSIAYKIVFTHA